MKRKYILLFLISLGVLLIALSKLSKKHDTDLINIVESVWEKCEPPGLLCKSSASMLKDIYNSAKGSGRSSISKDEMPVIRIYMTEGAVSKVDNKRKSVLEKKRPILISDKKDWVKATIVAEHQNKQEKSDVLLRLKGDWGDHLEDPKKLSFRIKTRGGGYLFGTKVFSIQHPITRNYAYEPLLFDQMRTHGILTPRYKFVDVTLNDFPVGVMAMEEHFSKEMLEAQNRRDGPILAISEDSLWDQWNINYNTSSSDSNPTLYNFYGPRDSFIKDYNSHPFKRGTIPTTNLIRGQSMWRDFLDGNLSARQTFDYEKLSMYWVLVNIWQGCHAMNWHNRRYYFNPISGLLEPIGFDHSPTPENFLFCSDIDINTALKDPLFLTQTINSAVKVYNQINSDEFESALEVQQDLYYKIFEYEAFEEIPKKLTKEVLAKNLQLFLSKMESQFAKYGSTDRAYHYKIPGFFMEKFVKNQPDLALHFSSHYYPNMDGGIIEFRNLTLDSIQILDVYKIVKGQRKEKLLLDPFNLESGSINPSVVSKIANSLYEVENKKAKHLVDYEYRGKKYTSPIHFQLKNAPIEYHENALSLLKSMPGLKEIDEENKHVLLKKDRHEFLQSLFLPQGWTLSVQAGAELNFQNGSLLKLQGPLKVKGNKQNPVIMNIETDERYNDMGSWGGILVSKSSESSFLDYLILNGTHKQNLKNRQDFHGLTGCLSFFESDVIIKNSFFNQAQCEDALNIVRSDFLLDEVTIFEARADAFDSDFSVGEIKNSKFSSSGNDGIDISGTRLEVKTTKMENIGDKAISVGEKSFLKAEDIKIFGAVLGIVSKDLSDVKVKDARMSKISGTGLMTYIKKNEYGPSSIDCTECFFLETTQKYGSQEGTKITINGKKIPRGSLSKKQMIDAGLIDTGES
jgi:hypothetical protein